MATERELILRLRFENEASSELTRLRQNLRDLGQQTAEVGQQAAQSFGDFRASFNEAFGDFGQPINSLADLRSQLSGLAGSLAATGVKESAQFVRDSIANFAEYERALVDVARTTGYSKAETAALGEALRDLSAGALQGQVTADELAKIAEAAGQLGITAQADILAFTESVAQVASATGLSMDKTADGFSKIAGTFQKSLEQPRISVNAFGQAITQDFGSAYFQIGRIGSAFDALADSTQGSIDGIMNRVQRIGGMAASFRLTVDQTAALAAVMESVGMSAEKGSTAANVFMSTLLTQSQSFAAALKLNGEALEKAISKDPMAAIEMVLEGMEKLEQEQGPKELILVMEQLLGKGDGIREFALKMSDAAITSDGKLSLLAQSVQTAANAFNEGTRSADSFAQAANTTVGQWTQIKNAADDISKSLGQQLSPAVSSVSALLVTSATYWADAFRKDNVDAFFDTVVGGVNKIPTAVGLAWEQIASLTMTGITAAQATWESLATSAQTTWDNITEAGAAAWTTLIADAQAGAQRFVADVAALPGEIADELSAQGERLTASLIQPFQAAADKITALKDKFVVFGGGDQMAGLAQSNATLDAFAAKVADFKTANLDLLASNAELRASYQQVFQGLQTAIAANESPSQALIAQFTAMREEINAVGVEAYGQSTFPDMTAAMQTSTVTAGDLTEQIESVKASVVQLDAEYKAAKATDSALSTEKKANLDAEIDKLRALETTQRELERAEKARADAAQKLWKDAERNREIEKQALVEKDRLEAQAYQTRRQEAAESIRWLQQLDDAAKRRLFAEGDALDILRDQGVMLDELQQTEVWRMQHAWQTEDAYREQTLALQAQLDPMADLLSLSSDLSDNFGKLSGGLGKIGDLFSVDTSKIEGVLGKLQGFAELPQTIKGIADSFGGIGQAFGGLGNIGGMLSGIFGNLGSILGGGGLTGVLGGLGGALGGVVAAAGPFALAGGAIYGAWELLGGLFEHTQSEGTKAANAMQDFVVKNIQSGAELSAAMNTNFDAMTQAGFDFATFIQQTGTTMDQTFGGISANWQQGATAIDIFTQAVGAAVGNMEKAPQIALQMMASFQDMGLTAEQAGAQMLQIATAAGMSEAQIQALQAALSGVQTQLSGAGEEGATTTVIFDDATVKAGVLTGQTQQLSGALGQVTGQLAGAGAEGLETNNVFALATNSAMQLSGMTGQLSGEVGGLTMNLGGTNVETTLATGAMGQAGTATQGLAQDMTDLNVQLEANLLALTTFKDMLANLPSEQRISVMFDTQDNIPGLAAGGVVRSPLVWVGERGPELAALPVGTRVFPHSASARLTAQGYAPQRFADGGIVRPETISAAPINIYINAPVLDRRVVKEIDAELRKLSSLRAGV